MCSCVRACVCGTGACELCAEGCSYAPVATPTHRYDHHSRTRLGTMPCSPTPGFAGLEREGKEEKEEEKHDDDEKVDKDEEEEDVEVLDEEKVEEEQGKRKRWKGRESE